MSANPCRTRNTGKCRVLLHDRAEHKTFEDEGFFGTFFEAYWWASQNGCDLLQYTSLT